MIGRTISHYRVVERLGAGGMGVVYKAEDTRLGRFVALKFLSDAMLKDPSALERFRREARSASSLNHPNICTIYEVDEVDGTPFLAMELLEGSTLKERLDQGPLADDQLIDVAIEFADALAAAHAARIIHRDLKPANLFLTRNGHLKILDFGLAKVTTDHRDDSSKLATAARDLTATDTTLGTVSYMSPEQARGDDLDARTDLFSFGAVLYEMTTGTRAFNGATTAMIFDAILHRDPPLMGGRQQSLQPIVSKALAKDRELRYQSAADIRADLKRLKHDTAPTLRTTPVAPRRNRAIGVILAVAIVAVLASVLLWRSRAVPATPSGKQTTVAVLPFANLGSGHERDYLKLAVPDELITILSHSPALAVRPFAMTRKYTGDIDPQQTGRALNVSNVITGDYRDNGGHLGLTLEAIDVEKNDVLWRESLDVPGDDLIALRNELSSRVRNGLLPRLHVSVDDQEKDRPRNDEAYALFMSAAAISADPVPNRDAIQKLARAVHLDPGFAPAWSALSNRYYIENEYGGGGEEARTRSRAAAERALQLDPDLMEPARRLLLLDVEQGQLQNAYIAAREMVRRRPGDGSAHFAVSYVLRYAGLIDEAARECELARRADPTNFGIRSCSLVFIQLGDFGHARQYLDADRGSVWAKNIEINIALRQGRINEAVQQASDPKLNDPIVPFMQAKVAGKPPGLVDAAAEQAKHEFMSVGDGEPAYFGATVFAAVGRVDDALDLLQTIPGRQYCGYPAMDREAILAEVRKSPRYPRIRAAAMQCQQRFVDWRAKNAP